MRRPIWDLHLSFLLLIVVVVSTIGCIASDRNMRYDQTKNTLKQLAQIIIAVHSHDPALLKERSLHDILIMASKWGHVSPDELTHDTFEKDIWGNPFLASYKKIQESNVYTITSPGPKASSGEERNLSVKIVFKHGIEPKITFQGFP